MSAPTVVGARESTPINNQYNMGVQVYAHTNPTTVGARESTPINNQYNMGVQVHAHTNPTTVWARESTPINNQYNMGVQVHAHTNPTTVWARESTPINNQYNMGVQVHAPTTPTTVGARESTPTKQDSTRVQSQITTTPKYDRKSYRHNGHDYDGGFYFVTICTQNYQHFFGKIVDGKMIFSALGQFVDNNIANIKTHHPYCDPIQWQVMPNHVHAILYINPDLGVQVHAPTTPTTVGARESTPTKPFKNTPLGTVVGCLKASVTTFARQRGIQPFAWQTRFHDRIIRNMYEAAHISDYIRDNVAKWNGRIEDHKNIMGMLGSNVGVLAHAPTNRVANNQDHKQHTVGVQVHAPTNQTAIYNDTEHHNMGVQVHAPTRKDDIQMDVQLHTLANIKS